MSSIVVTCPLCATLVIVRDAATLLPGTRDVACPACGRAVRVAVV